MPQVTVMHDQCKPDEASHALKYRKHHSTDDSDEQLRISKKPKLIHDKNRSKSRPGEAQHMRKPGSHDTNYHHIFLDHIEVYKHDLRKELDTKLDEVNNDLCKRLSSITNSFETQCSTVQEAVQPLRRGLATERVAVRQDDQMRAVVALEKQMKDFTRIKEEKYIILVSLWKEYEEVQTQLIQCAVSMLGEDETNISEGALSENCMHGEELGGVEGSCQRIQIGQACQQYREFEKGYTSASASFDELQSQLGTLTHTVLKENKALLQAFKTSREKQIDELKGFLRNMGMF